MKPFYAAAWGIACVGAAAPAAWAQTDLTIAATGQVAVPPDEAVAALTIQAQDASAAKAQAAVNTAMAKALVLARKLPGIKPTTGGYNSYSTTPEHGGPVQFTAQQSLNLSIMSAGGVPPEAFANLLGTLQNNGLLLNSLAGDLSDAGQRLAQQAAIADALAQIQAQAAGVAAKLHEQVGTIKSLNVNAGSAPGPRPMMVMAVRKAEPAPQSVPDNVQIEARVTAEIALTP